MDPAVRSFKRHCVVLVHGTWSPNAAWTRPNSLIRRKMAEAWGDRTEVLDFNWSGSNTQAGRRAASVTLAVWIRHHLSNSYTTIQLVGHSHGGNIATRAAALQRHRISSVVTLATPFVEGTSAFYGPLPSIPASTITRSPAVPLLVSATLWLAMLFMIGANSITDLVYTVLALIIVTISMRVLRHLRWEPERAVRRARRRYVGFGSTAVPTLVIRYVADEALSAIWMGLALPRRLLTGATRISSEQTRHRLGLVAAPLIFLIVLAFGASTFNATLAGLRIITTVSVICFAIAAVFVFANRLIGPVLAAITLGPRSAIDFFHMALSVRALPLAEQPDLVRDVELVPPAAWRPRFSLRWRHCYIYSDSQTVDFVIHWLSDHMVKAPIPADAPASAIEDDAIDA